MRYQTFPNFLTPEECQQIIELAKPRLERSTGWNVTHGKQEVTDYRTSYQMNFNKAETELIDNVEKRIAAKSGLPVSNQENLQVLRYEAPNGHYKVHWDYFDPSYAGNQSILARGGQRLLTFTIYLNNVSKGGETNFPKVVNMDRTDSLRVKPEEGKGFMWYNVLLNGSNNIDRDTLHQGLDVLEGQKWLLTCWVRERAFL